MQQGKKDISSKRVAVIPVVKYTSANTVMLQVIPSTFFTITVAVKATLTGFDHVSVAAVWYTSKGTPIFIFN